MNDTIARDDVHGDDRRRARRRRRRIEWALTAWLVVVTLYFLWEAATYHGLYALLAEWQFDTFGRYLPILTLALPILVFGSPALLMLRSRRRDDMAASPATRRQAVALGSGFRRVLFVTASVLGVAALATFVWALFLPTMATPTRNIVLGTPASVAPAEGPAFVKGQILYKRTAAFNQNLLFMQRGVRFAPIVVPGQSVPSIQYFVELPPSTSTNPQVPSATRAGVLMRSHLPGSIVQLYRYAGYHISKPYYLLYASEQTMRWPYYVTGAQLALAALIVLIAALLQHRHVRNETMPDEEPVAETPAEPAAG